MHRHRPPEFRSNEAFQDLDRSSAAELKSVSEAAAFGYSHADLDAHAKPAGRCLHTVCSLSGSLDSAAAKVIVRTALSGVET